MKVSPKLHWRLTFETDNLCNISDFHIIELVKLNTIVLPEIYTCVILVCNLQLMSYDMYLGRRRKAWNRVDFERILLL